MAVKPTVCPLNHPSLRLVRAFACVGWRPALWNVRGVAALRKPLSHVIEVVAFVGAQVLRLALTRRWTRNSHGINCSQSKLLIVAVRSRHAQTKRRAPLVADDVTFRAQFRAIRRILARLLPAQRGFRRGTVEGLPEPENATSLVILSEQESPQSSEDATPAPLLKPPMKSRTAPVLLRGDFPLAASPKDVEDAIEDGAVGNYWPAGRVRRLLFAQERFDLLPQIIGDVPYCFEGGFGSHCSVRPNKAYRLLTLTL